MKAADPVQLENVLSKTAFDASEATQWKIVADNMILPYEEEIGIFVQDDNYLSMYPLPLEELDRKKEMPIEGKWPIEKYLRYNVTKQADVVLSLVLFRDRYDMDQKRRNYNFYEQRTIHGSSLSSAMHSIMASEIGRYNQAYEYYLCSSRLDLDDYNKDTKEGLHISSMGGTLLTIFYGFGGITLTDDGIKFLPALPEAWSELSFKFHYRQRILKVRMNKNAVYLSVLKGENINVQVFDREVVLTSEECCVETPEYIKNKAMCEAVIFDLDGVIVDTAKYHYQAWKQIADEEGIYFDEVINEKLKGVSRQESLNIIVKSSAKGYTQEQLKKTAEIKNEMYVKLLENNLSVESILPGIEDFLNELKEKNIKTAIYSASRNTPLILEKLGIGHYFDVVVNGNHVTKSKPDPEGFILAADQLGINRANCVVVEDAYSGIQAAKNAGMKVIGIGDKIILHNAECVLSSTQYLNYKRIETLY